MCIVALIKKKKNFFLFKHLIKIIQTSLCSIFYSRPAVLSQNLWSLFFFFSSSQALSSLSSSPHLSSSSSSLRSLSLALISHQALISLQSQSQSRRRPTPSTLNSHLSASLLPAYPKLNVTGPRPWPIPSKQAADPSWRLWSDLAVTDPRQRAPPPCSW